MDLSEKQNETKSLAVVRGHDMARVKTALCDLLRFAGLTFVDSPRRCEPVFADNILVHVMNNPLKSCCEAAAVVPLAEDASAAIGRVRKIHPPAHVIIVGPRHEIYHEIVNYVDVLPEIDLTLPGVISQRAGQTADAESGGQA